MNERPTLLQSFAVTFEYPVVFTRGVFSPVNPALVEMAGRHQEPLPHRCAVLLDANVASALPALLPSVRGYFAAHQGRLSLAAEPMLIPGGETAKQDLSLVESIAATLLHHQLCRHSFVLAIGGGSVLDVAGLAVALIHRGLRLIRIPTTVLAQNDAGIGVKNAVNYLGGKNLLGTFAPPYGVINDFEFLKTLSPSAWIDGIAEAFKVAIIKDAVFFDFLCSRARALAWRDQSIMEELIYRCAQLHLEHIRTSGDPFELGAARPLDFGHWSAHKLEVMSGYRVSHGQAVAIGIMLDSFYAREQGWLPASDAERIYQGLTGSGLVLWHNLLERCGASGRLDILGGLREFQEHLGGQLSVTFPLGIGNCREVNAVDPARVVQSIQLLKQRQNRGAR